jgi:hypothetical protein
VVDSILCSTADSDHLSVLDGDVQSTSIAAEQTGRRCPGINIVDGHSIDQMLIYAYGPGLAC